jgi:2-C-methyl-D-erythritol 4-phosphate cytidylyltransferase
MSTAAILLAAGSGERLGSDIPKAFVELAARPLLSHAIDAVEGSQRFDSVYVAVPAGWEERAREIIGVSRERARVLAGGETRQESVLGCLRSIDAEALAPEMVVCHDVARPFARPELFAAVLDALSDADGAIPVVPVADTIKAVDDGHVSKTLEREQLVAAQTPQAFRFRPLLESHERARTEGFVATDDAAVLEHAGRSVVVVPGDPENLKITTPADLRAAEALIASRG